MDAAKRIDRRELLSYAGLGAGALILGGVAVDPVAARRPGRRRTPPLAHGGSFPQGVASGQPATRGVSLWTRLDGFDRPQRLRLEVARDPDFRRVIERRTLRVGPGRDYTIETRLGRRLLDPGEQYFYRFETRDQTSTVGRFRTLRPADSREPVRIAFFSCQDYQAGFYGAHAAIANEDVDLAVCLGDYIYERTFYEGPRRDTLGANGDGEVQTLPEYRAKYQLYKADPDLQAMHAAHPFLAIWDDHEVEDNYAGAGAGDATQQPRAPFLERKSAAYQAFYDYMPFSRIAGTPRVGHDLYRRLTLGANAELFLLDERQYRDDQPCDDAFFTPCPEAESEPRRFLGRRQLDWLKRGLRESSATWKLIGNQLMIMSLDSVPSTPIAKDSWDGYGLERRELMTHIAARGIHDVSFLTGDIHTFFAGDVGLDGRGPESHATEFVGGSITSLGIPETLEATTGTPPAGRDALALVGRNLLLTNPHLRYLDERNRGYGVVEASQRELGVRFKAVDAMRRSSSARTVASFRVASGAPRVELA